MARSSWATACFRTPPFRSCPENPVPMKDFKKLAIWQLGIDITDQVYDLFDGIPWQKAGRLRDQATAAAVSIPSNIAEGNSRRSEKDKYRFHEYALGSTFELQTQILVVLRRKWVPEGRLDKLLADIELEQKKVQAFMGSLKP